MNERAVFLRRLATGVLFAAFALRVAAAFLPDTVWARCLKAFCEAAVVGGLADWFAVTALFRRPLGLPIPHTRILPENKDRIGASLSRFVVGNFLNREVVARELERVDLSAKAAEHLELKAGAIAAGAAELLPRLLAALDDQDISRFLEAQFAARLRAVQVAPVAGRLLELVTSGDKAERVVDDLLKAGGDALADNHDVLERLIAKEMPIPDMLGVVKDKLAGYVAREAVKRFQRAVEEVRADPAHELRARIRERVGRLAVELRESPEFLARGEELKQDFLANPNVAAWASKVWSELKDSLVADAARPDGEIRRRLEAALRRVAAQVKADEPLRAKFNASLRAAAADIVAGNAEQASRIIQETVARWDGEELGGKLEAEVGSDLQFVRLNGTLVGGLMGLALHLGAALFG
ncbi:MAG: DUF445 domain-containing protein [Elusimicrobia bacterium]|nr:DUF445 domain-containing protein [Elusimicrobiota bacterium]